MIPELSGMEHIGNTILDTSTRGLQRLQSMWQQHRELGHGAAPDVCVIEIKGRHFEATKAYLTRSSHFFKAIFDGEIQVEVVNRGTYVLRDRDPVAFECLLTFMKYGHVPIPSPVDWRIIEAEAYFYGINGLSSFVPEVLQLNVGGQIFDTTRATLLKAPHFERLFQSPQELIRDDVGRIFIDLDPTYFGAILSILRTDPNWNFTEKSGLLLKGLFKDANHATITAEIGRYGIFLPHTLIQWLVDHDVQGEKDQAAPVTTGGLLKKKDGTGTVLQNVMKKVQERSTG
mmetsp:Transcript_11828/g.22781  ORF Transcript_11828/g.22781 Transcript_11828/m.22781 type:complete len:287 (+) Transcript_11828:44-904(+)|eukprot:CAMPEP_0194664884 /NCGR_PEP_ID=MMETSP0295-20121207/1742_1 /TAXON_ID=39354 /ORGANISM="Heterosigma akashiwo, Strain CCMP2393" /LENGTH=286 /DNA_ID=CAMNT_0039546741 /DNA_START=63 /DNA_END=923 /DNA_ORIENTATION=-